MTTPTQDAAAEHVTAKLNWLAAHIPVPDGGQYRNDWPAAVERLVRDRDKALAQRDALATAATTLATRWTTATTWEGQPATVERAFGATLRDTLAAAAPDAGTTRSQWRTETDPRYQAAHDATINNLIATAKANLYQLGPGREVQKAALGRAVDALTALLYHPATPTPQTATTTPAPEHIEPEHTGCGNGECCTTCSNENLPYPFMCTATAAARTGTCEHQP